MYDAPISSTVFTSYREARESFYSLVAHTRTPLPESIELRKLALRRLRIHIRDTLARIQAAWEQCVLMEESLLRNILRMLPPPSAAVWPSAELLRLHEEVQAELTLISADSRLSPRHGENLAILAGLLRTLHAAIVAQKKRLQTLMKLDRRCRLEANLHKDPKIIHPDPRQPWQRNSSPWERKKHRRRINQKRHPFKMTSEGAASKGSCGNVG